MIFMDKASAFTQGYLKFCHKFYLQETSNIKVSDFALIYLIYTYYLRTLLLSFISCLAKCYNKRTFPFFKITLTFRIQYFFSNGYQS